MLIVCTAGIQEVRSGGTADPLKYGAVVRNCIWRFCIVSPPPKWPILCRVGR